MGPLSDLLSHFEGMGSAQAIQILEGLLAQTGHGSAEGIRINLAQEENGTIGVSVGGRSFSFTPQNAPRNAGSSDITTDYVPKPTLQRWQEEMAIVPAASGVQMTRLVKHVINRLLPSAYQHAEEEAERVRIFEEEAAATAAKLKEEEMASAAAVALPESRDPTPPTMQSSPDVDVEMGE